jgi:hypothetical protein
MTTRARVEDEATSGWLFLSTGTLHKSERWTPCARYNCFIPLPLRRPAVFEQDEEITLRMSWDLICKTACSAFVHGMSMDQFVEAALRGRIAARQASKK